MGILGDLAKQIDGIKDTVMAALGKARGDGKPYNSVFQYSTNNPSFNKKNWSSNKGYSFQVVRTKPNGQWSPDGSWQEFTLQINPQELNQDEVFAIEVTPTLRGVLVEHHGVTIKDISISGTTGISPMRKEGGAVPDSGDPLFQKGRSGYQEFQELRSYFRVYAEQKRLDQGENGELRMIFKNHKDEEYLYVEPQKFTMKRSASRPFLYDYNIALKGIGTVEPKKDANSNWYDSIDNVLEKVQDGFTLANRIITGGAGILLRTERDLYSVIVNPIQSINTAITSYRGAENMIRRAGQTSTKSQTLSGYGITRKDCQKLLANLERVEANLNDVIGKNSPAYDNAKGRVPTVVGPSTRIPTAAELGILNGIGHAKKSTIALLALGDKVFEPNVFESNSQAMNRYQDSKGNGKIDIPTPASVKATDILGTDDIHTIASREMGNPDKFRDIVILNNLKPPYISDAGGNGVLKRGDKILIPQQNPTVPTGVADSRNYNITAEMSEIEKQLGVDIRLTESGDLAVSNTNDLDLIAGIGNMVQAMAIKLDVEKGSLKRHPGFGAGLQIGRKAKNTLAEIKRDVIGTFNQDARIESIPSLELNQQGGTIEINITVKLRNLEQPVPIPVKLNNS